MQILKVIGLLMEYPDELLWECKDDALALIRRDAPMLTDFALDLLNAPLLDKQAEWCEVFDRGRTTSLLLPLNHFAAILPVLFSPPIISVKRKCSLSPAN
ncbi:TPA: hypothetical protein KII26_002321 [Escherichia coli]|nr:hypothetical protein [Escherichia coli]